jgi:hypothetical protein
VAAAEVLHQLAAATVADVVVADPVIPTGTAMVRAAPSMQAMETLTAHSHAATCQRQNKRHAAQVNARREAMVVAMVAVTVVQWTTVVVRHAPARVVSRTRCAPAST